MSTNNTKTAINDFLFVNIFHSRFFVLFLATLTWFGLYYSMDIPSVIKADIVQFLEVYNHGQSEYLFHLMYSLYSFPNIILPILSGLLVDRIGFNLPLLLFCGLVCIGNGITYFGFSMESVALTLLGRFIFGIGGESLSICINSLLVFWFKEKELGFSQALCLSIGRAAGILTCFLSPHTAKYGVSSPYALATWICFASFMAALLLSFINSSYKTNFSRADRPSVHSEISQNQNDSSKEIIKDLFRCKTILWFHIAAMTFFYLSYLSFNIVASGYIPEMWYTNTQMTHAEQVEKTGNSLGIPLIVSSLLFPVFGYITDKCGKRLHFLLASSLILMTTFILFLTTTSILPLFTLGLAYAIFGSVLWPVLALLVPQRIVATAYGAVTIIQNFAMTLFPLILGHLLSTSGSNLLGMMTLLFNATLAMIFVLIVWYYDTKNKVSLATTDQAAYVSAIEEEYRPREHREKDAIFTHEEVEEEEETIQLI